MKAVMGEHFSYHGLRSLRFFKSINSGAPFSWRPSFFAYSCIFV